MFLVGSSQIVNIINENEGLVTDVDGGGPFVTKPDFLSRQSEHFGKAILCTLEKNSF